jgi:uncharacterized protein (DUF488 family)
VKTIFGIGHSIHPIDQFIGLLCKNGVDHLIDVRNFPRSRWPQYNRAALQTSIVDHDIGYTLVAKLGGKHPLPYGELREIIEGLPAITRSNAPCLMCSEGKYVDCHRHYLLSPVINDLGYNYMQITPTGELIEDRGPSEKMLNKMAKFLPAKPASLELGGDRQSPPLPVTKHYCL